MRLKYQLFLTLLLSSILLIAIMVLVTSWSFNRNFSSFLLDRQIKLSQSVVQSLIGYYDVHGDWGEGDDRSELRAILRSVQSGRQGLRPGLEPRGYRDRRNRNNAWLILTDEYFEPVVGRYGKAIPDLICKVKCA